MIVGTWYAAPLFLRPCDLLPHAKVANTFHPAAIAATRNKRKTESIDLEEIHWQGAIFSDL